MHSKIYHCAGSTVQAEVQCLHCEKRYLRGKREEGRGRGRGREEEEENLNFKGNFVLFDIYLPVSSEKLL